MTDLSQEAAGLPAPFDSLEPLKHYVALLEQVVADPSPANLAAYVAYDSDVFTPVVVLYVEYGHNNRHAYGRQGFRPGILYDAVSMVVESDDPSDKRLRNAARVVLHGVVSGLTESCAFPYEESREAYELIDAAYVRLVGHDPKHLAFARKRTSLTLLNVWSEAKYWPHLIAGRPQFAMTMAEVGWEVFGAPYGSARLAKLAAKANPRFNR